MSHDPAPRKRFTLRLTLSTLLIGLLAVVVGGAVVISLTIRQKTIARTLETLQREVSRSVADKIRSRIEPAEQVLREALRAAEQGRLPLDDGAALAWRTAERIRHEDRFEWLGYVSADGAAAGAVRLTGGEGILVLHATDADADLVAEHLAEDDTRTERERRPGGVAAIRAGAWYEAGLTSDGPVWTGRYLRPLDGTYGRACALAYRKDGEVLGVFGVGYGTAFLGEYFRSLQVAETGCVLALHAETGEITVAPDEEAIARLQPVVDEVVSDLPGGVAALSAGTPHTASVTHEGVTYAVALEKQDWRGALQWINVVVVPQDELVGYFGEHLAYGLGAVLVLFLVAALLAQLLSARVSKPLRAIAQDLERIGAFDLSASPTPPSRIHEVAVVGDAVARMKASLRSFGRYVPTDLVRELLQQGREAQLDGAPRPLTLFFSDVKGFTAMSEGMPAQDLVDALGDYLDVVTRAVKRTGGTIDKFMGDGVLAFFNAPHDDPHHAEHACAAALATQNALAEARERWEAEGRPPFHTRIGLHTDEVVVGNIGTPERFSYTVLGDGVNFAARLESLNKAYGTAILASGAMREAAGDGYLWRRIDVTAVSGRAEGGAVYELLGEEGGVDAARLEARDAYEAALAAYLERRFDDAVRGFEEASRRLPDDKAAPVLLARAQAYAASPPPADWNGVHVQTRK